MEGGEGVTGNAAFNIKAFKLLLIGRRKRIWK
jgi:hypothetical protein